MALPDESRLQADDALRQGLSDRPVSYGSQVWRRLRRNRLALIGAGVLTVLILVSVLAPVIAPYGRDEPDLKAIYAAPDAFHLLGTDELGRDVFTRLMWGGQVSFQVAFSAVIIYMTAGVLVGGIAGYFGGRIDNTLMRIADVVLSFPFFLLVLTLVAIFGPSLRNLIIVLSITSWPVPARLVRGEFLSIREREYVEAAHAMGAPAPRIIWRHMLPNALAPLIVSATLDVAGLILTEAALSYLGFGVRDPIPSWGNMLNGVSISMLEDMWWIWVPPGICIFLAVISINFLGDGLRDALDPRLKQ